MRTSENASPTTATPLLRMRGISKSFPGVRALHQVNLTLHPGEVLALLGENGAGKSTLIRTLAGVCAPDDGSIEISGRPVTFRTPQAARDAGIAVIHQEFNLIPGLTVRENLFLGQERTRWGWINAKKESTDAKQIFELIGMEIDPDARCRDLTVAQQQVVEIARALIIQARMIVMDEPTAALSPREVSGLFRVIRDLRSRGIGIIYVSHRLDEIFDIADRATILRDGEHVATKSIASLSRDRIIELMVGRQLDQEFPKKKATIGDVRLRAENLSRPPAVRDVSFSIRAGEVLALTGLIGAGRTETARLIFGADRSDRGTVSLDGKQLRIRSPRDAISSGICLLSEDRKRLGLVLNRSVLENFGLPNMREFAPSGWIFRGRELSAWNAAVARLQIKSSGTHQPAEQLSGGNQQKIVLAKWLQRNADVIIFDEPTRGIDVGAKHEIYQLINQLAAQGKAILMISSELPEVLGMADRILVMREGRIAGEISDPARATQQQIMELAVH